MQAAAEGFAKAQFGLKPCMLKPCGLELTRLEPKFCFCESFRSRLLDLGLLTMSFSTVKDSNIQTSNSTTHAA